MAKSSALNSPIKSSFGHPIHIRNKTLISVLQLLSVSLLSCCRLPPRRSGVAVTASFQLSILPSPVGYGFSIDEVGFAQAHSNLNAWTPRGAQHQIEAKRGKRLNVAGAWLNSGHLFTVSLWESMTTSLFGSFLGLLLKKSTKPLTVILDNASIHNARLTALPENLPRAGAGFNAVFPATLQPGTEPD